METLLFCTRDAEFLSEKLGKVLDGKVELWGADDHLGEMIYSAAQYYWRQHQKEAKPISVRQVTVSEPGGKARIVTCGPWWLQVVQQPTCHLLCEILAKHPAAHSVMLRADQAWQSLSVWQNYPQDHLIDGHWVLSSDLKSATDTIDYKVADAELYGFCEAIGYLELYESIKEFASPRLVHMPSHELLVTARGIPMGEPMAKPCLILLGLCVERIALAKFLRVPILTMLGGIPKWRVFHLGGDDHVVAGPKGYLDGITREHRRVGGIPSLGKHGLSRTAVVYTEKLLYFKGMKINIPQKEVDNVYDQSIFIDSIKIRNLSPFRKGCERENEVSSYIGKCKAVANSCMYLKGNMKVKGRISISRLVFRFRRFLPTPQRRTLSAIVAMPPSLGGLGLSVNVERSAEKLPEIFRKAYRAILDGKDTEFKIRSVLTGMWKPHARRNVRIDDFSQLFKDQVLEQWGSKDIVWVREKFDPSGQMSNARLIAEARNHDIYTIDAMDALVEKPYIVRKLLEGKQDDFSLRVVPIRVRVSRAWERLEALPIVTESEAISFADVPLASKAAKELRFVDLSEITTAGFDPLGNAIDETSDEVDWSAVEFKDIPLKQLILLGSPGLSITM